MMDLEMITGRASQEVGIAGLGGLLISSDVWLAEVMSRNVHRVSGSVQDGRQDQALCALKQVTDRTGFSYARVSTSDVRTVHLLERCGFYLVDTSVTLQLMEPSFPPLANVVVRLARSEDRLAVEGIARRNFMHSRFHLDPAIPKSLADEIKSQWVGNYFRGGRGEHMVVAEDDGQVVGFAQLLNIGGNTLIIDLIAVDKNHRGRGFAREMIRYSANIIEGLRALRVGTQIVNSESLRIYQALGFVLVSSSYVFHHHV